MGSIVSGWVWVDSYFAKANIVEIIEANAIDIRINTLKDGIRWYQDQMAYIMSRCGKRNPEELPEHAYKTYKDYEEKKKEMERELEVLMRKRNGI